MKYRIAALIASAAVVLAACSQTVNGTSIFPATTSALASKMLDATQSLSSLHLSVRETLAGQSIVATSDEQVSHGKPTGVRIDETIPQFGEVTVIRLDGKTYARVPTSHRTSGKPWLLVRAGSSNPLSRTMAQSLASADQLTGFTAFTSFVKAAKNLRLVGVEQVSGVTTGHYRLSISVKDLPGDFPQKKTLQQVGVSSLPLDMWMDEDGHVRKMTENLTVLSQHVSVVISLGKFDAPVHITAPPADQVDDS